MDYLMQRCKLRGQMINVPEGLPELLSDITREVLRCQPSSDYLCQFVIDYMHAVIDTREKTKIAKRAIDQAMQAVEAIISDLCICELPKLKSEEMALVMEDCFKKFLEKRRCERNKEKEIIKFHEEDMLDALIAKCKFTKEELQLSRPAIEDAYNRFVIAYSAANEQTDGTDALYEFFKDKELKRLEAEKRESAAVLIQAVFRGFLVRKLYAPELEKRKTRNTMGSQDTFGMADAVTKIQAAFREYMVRPNVGVQYLPTAAEPMEIAKNILSSRSSSSMSSADFLAKTKQLEADMAKFEAEAEAAAAAAKVAPQATAPATKSALEEPMPADKDAEDEE